MFVYVLNRGLIGLFSLRKWPSVMQLFGKKSVMWPFGKNLCESAREK